MNNLDRKAKLEKALADYDSDSMFTAENYKGAQIENERLAPLHAALIEAVKALEEFADFDNQYEPKMVCWPASEYMKKSRIALAKIDEALEGMGGE